MPRAPRKIRDERPVVPLGRPTECTEEVIERAEEAAALGIPLRHLPDHCGVHDATFWRWWAAGKDPNAKPYAAFRERVKAARASGARKLVGKIAEQPERWQALAWILERSHGYRVDVDVEAPDIAPEPSTDELVSTLAKLPADVLLAALAAKNGEVQLAEEVVEEGQELQEPDPEDL